MQVVASSTCLSGVKAATTSIKQLEYSPLEEPTIEKAQYVATSPTVKPAITFVEDPTMHQKLRGTKVESTKFRGKAKQKASGTEVQPLAATVSSGMPILRSLLNKRGAATTATTSTEAATTSTANVLTSAKTSKSTSESGASTGADYHGLLSLLPVDKDGDDDLESSSTLKRARSNDTVRTKIMRVTGLKELIQTIGKK